VNVEPAAVAIARAVRARRIELNLSTDDAAARARIPEKAWRVIEQGTTNPSSLMLLALCKALDWTPGTIESLVKRELSVNGNGQMVVDLEARQPAPVKPRRRATDALDVEGLTPAEMSEVQDFIDEIRDSR
jgi:transcriptional regulator with XRE-family HTH domain